MMYGIVGFGIRVESILPVLLSVGCFLCIVFSFLSLCYDLCDGGVLHTSMFVGGLACLDVYLCQRTCRSRSSLVLLKVMIIGVGMGICMPTSTNRWMSMGRVG